MRDLVCMHCQKTMECYSEVGYDAPADGSEECSPFAEWLTLCRECEEKRDQINSNA